MTRPTEVFDPMLQHERTSLSWERTSISGMVLGLLTTRIGATIHPGLGVIGIVEVALAAGLLVWSGKHYEGLHGVLRAGESPTHPEVAKIVGLGVSAAIGVATILTVAHLITG